MRDLGRFATWIAREVESGEAQVQVRLPDYGNVLLGTATVPPVKVNVRNGHHSHVDFVADVEPGDVEGARKLANDWLDGTLESLQVESVATLPLKSGLFGLGSPTVSLMISRPLPGMPGFEIEALNFSDHGPPGHPDGMGAMASVSLVNDYPIRLDVPPLQFEALVPGCLPDDEPILLGDARTETVLIRPHADVKVNVSGMIRRLPTSLTAACPDSTSSPLDTLLGDYLAGKGAKIFIRGASVQDPSTPDWISSLMQGTTVPFPLPGHPFDNLIRNFSLADVHFRLPDPYADPDAPESHPRLSAIVKALVGLPGEINFNLDVDRVRAAADVFYRGQKLGELDLKKWQPANSSCVDDKGAGPGLLIESVVKDAPLQITDEDVFTEVVQSLLLGGKGAVLDVEAAVDVHLHTVLGEFVVREIPAKGKVFVKPISPGGLAGFRPQIGNLKILDTTKSSLRLQAEINLTNPTDYSAHIPYLDIHLLTNDTVLGHASAKNLDLVPGNNSHLLVEAVWNPSRLGGQNGTRVGRELLSQYLSGFNATVTLRTHESTIPSQPALGKALSALEIVVAAPKIRAPHTPDGGGGGGDDGDDDGDEGDDRPRFIKDATVLNALLVPL